MINDICSWVSKKIYMLIKYSCFVLFYLTMCYFSELQPCDVDGIRLDLFYVQYSTRLKCFSYLFTKIFSSLSDISITSIQKFVSTVQLSKKIGSLWLHVPSDSLAYNDNIRQETLVHGQWSREESSTLSSVSLPIKQENSRKLPSCCF